MKPYYETNLGKLYHGDCLEIMPELEPVDLVLTDPPYGIGESNKKNLSRGKWAEPKDYGEYEWDKKKANPKTIKMMLQISKNQIIFGGNYYGGLLGDTSCYLVWNKDNGMSDFADCELAWTSFKTATRIIKWRWQGMLKEAPEKRYYPTQKPVGLFMWILRKYSKDTDIICDPMVGGGTTALACERLNRKWIAIEIEEKSCGIAANRIESETAQMKLF